MTTQIKLVECPRDAMQGIKYFIPTHQKIKYLNTLLQVGFHTLDCGSFVSPKAIPQMADTAEVISQLSMENTSTKLLCIVANERGATEAVAYPQINYIGFPFSISPTFQMRNTNSSMEESFERVKKIQALCIKNNKQLVVYISMAFGNPYGDAYDAAVAMHWVDKMVSLGITIVSMADTVGLATALQVYQLMNAVIPAYPAIELGVHLHSTSANWEEKTAAALQAGCMRFDGALKGYGGCPMADDQLVGNMDTEKLIPYFQNKKLLQPLNQQALAEAADLASGIFL